jgi:hypothetical protein
MGAIHVIQQKFSSYSQTQQDVKNYAAKVLFSDVYELPEAKAPLILPLYYKLYQELKAAM